MLELIEGTNRFLSLSPFRIVLIKFGRSSFPLGKNFEKADVVVHFQDIALHKEDAKSDGGKKLVKQTHGKKLSGLIFLV